MATSCPVGFDAERLRDQVQRTYERVARDPESGFHFNVGATYAIESLGYPRAEIEALPASSTSRVAGVGNHRLEIVQRVAGCSRKILHQQ